MSSFNPKSVVVFHFLESRPLLSEGKRLAANWEVPIYIKV